MLAPGSKLSADTESGFRFERMRQATRLPFHRTDGQIENGQLHTACDVDAYGVGNHRIPRGQDAADRQPITLVRVRHEGSGHRDRKAAGVLHLIQGARFDVAAPDLVGRTRLALNERASGRRVVHQHLRQGAIRRIVEES